MINMSITSTFSEMLEAFSHSGRLQGLQMLSLSLSLSHTLSGTELSHTVPPSTTVWIAMAEWHCPSFCSFTPQIEEEANKH